MIVESKFIEFCFTFIFLKIIELLLLLISF